VIAMILTIDSQRRITLPESFSPGDHVLLVPLADVGFHLLPAIAATKGQFEQEVAEEIRDHPEWFPRA
jgi:hypothetical protein